MALRKQSKTFSQPPMRWMSRVLEQDLKKSSTRRTMSAPPDDIRFSTKKTSRLRPLNDGVEGQKLENMYRNSDLLTADSVKDGEVNLSFDTMSVTSSNPQKKTIVSFVIDEEEHNTEAKQTEKASEEKYDAVTVLLSFLYAIVITLIGTIFPISEAVRGEWQNDHIVGVFLVYLFLLSSAFLFYIQAGEYFSKKKSGRHFEKKQSHACVTTQSASQSKEGEANNSPGNVVVVRRLSRNVSPNEDVDTTPSNFQPSQLSDISEVDTPSNTDDSTDLNEEVMEHISFQTQTASLGHEAASIYLRLGVLIFGVGNFVFVALELESYFSREVPAGCGDVPLVYPMVFHMIFLVVQTFFILKHTKLSIKKHQGLARFGLMHVLATNLCVWVRILVKEVQVGITGHGAHHHYDEGAKANSTITACASSSTLLDQAAPYLFPFVLEYSLIAVAVMAGMFQSLYIQVSQNIIEMVRKTLRHRHDLEKDPNQMIMCSEAHKEEHGGGMFDKSHKGIYLGVLVLTGTIISVILFFYNLNSLHLQTTATMIFHITDIALNSLLIIAVISALISFLKLHFTLGRNNTIDASLLVLSFAGLFLFAGFILMSSFSALVHSKDLSATETTLIWLALAASFVNIIQALLQLVFVIDGLQRCSIRAKDRKEKPGRGMVTFLLITNVALWIFKTFQVKELGLSTQAVYYGRTPWAIILNVSLPLMLFFRFHSSVCMADIWTSAYEDEHNDMKLKVLH